MKKMITMMSDVTTQEVRVRGRRAPEVKVVEEIAQGVRGEVVAQVTVPKTLKQL